YLTRHHQGCRFRSPVRSSPCLWLPYEAGALGLCPDASDPAVASDTRQGGDGSRTLIRSSPPSTSRSLQPVSSLEPCDFVSQDEAVDPHPFDSFTQKTT